MKKLIALILAVVLSITMMTPIASAVDANDTPVVILRGDGVSLTKIDENGQEIEVYPVNVSSLGGKFGETAKNILIPFVTEGLLFDKWDNYYDVCYEELSPIMLRLFLTTTAVPEIRQVSALKPPEITETLVKLTDAISQNTAQQTTPSIMTGVFHPMIFPQVKQKQLLTFFTNISVM